MFSICFLFFGSVLEPQNCQKPKNKEIAKKKTRENLEKKNRKKIGKKQETNRNKIGKKRKTFRKKIGSKIGGKSCPSRRSEGS